MPTDLAQAQPGPTDAGGASCGTAPAGPAALGEVRKLVAPRRLAPLPASTLAPGARGIECIDDTEHITTRVVRKDPVASRVETGPCFETRIAGILGR